MFKKVITFPLSKSKISIEWRNNHIPDFNYFLDKINTNIYNYNTFIEQWFQDEGKYKRGSDIKVTCVKIFQRQHLTMTTLLIFCTLHDMYMVQALSIEEKVGAKKMINIFRG